jgi:hypothetical protein
LSEWPGLRGDLVRDEVIYAEEYREREQLIRSCMREHGFTYVPIPLQYGPSAPGYHADPNDRIVRGLSPDEQRSYYLAMANSPGPDDVGPDFDLDVPGGAGCIGEAHQALPGIFRVPAELEHAVADTRAIAGSDPAVVTAAEGWRACVVGRLEWTPPADLQSPSDVARMSDRGLTNGPGEPTTTELDDAAGQCRGDLDAAFDSARVRAEAAFVRAHYTALVAHRDSLIADHRALGLSLAELQ